MALPEHSRVRNYGGVVLVVLVALSSVWAPGIFRIVCWIFGIIVFCMLVMELKTGQEAQAKLRRYEVIAARHGWDLNEPLSLTVPKSSL